VLDGIDAAAIGLVRGLSHSFCPLNSCFNKTFLALLERGVAVTEGDDEQVSCLTRAAARNSPEMVELLLKHGAGIVVSCLFVVACFFTFLFKDVDGNGLHAFGSALYQVMDGVFCFIMLNTFVLTLFKRPSLAAPNVSTCY
jgi:hypothetical protein